MSNTLGGLNIAQIAQETLSTLMIKMLPIRAFATDFSAEISTVGESVSTRVATQPSIQDFTATSAAADVTTTAKTVTLSNYKGVRLGFTDLEWVKSAVYLPQVFIRPVTNTVANAVMDSVFALVTGANYGSSGADYISGSGGFDSDSVADAAKLLSDANVPSSPRAMILNTAYFNSLAKDDAIKLSYAYGSPDAIRDYKIPRVGGFDIYEYNDIPSTGGLAGIFCAPEGLLMAARVAALPQGFPGDVATATDADTGLTIQVRRWYSADDRLNYLEAGLIWGVAVGVAGNLKRILTTA